MGEPKLLKLYRPISEFKSKGDKCLGCGNENLFIKIKDEAILFCPKCYVVACEWY